MDHRTEKVLLALTVMVIVSTMLVTVSAGLATEQPYAACASAGMARDTEGYPLVLANCEGMSLIALPVETPYGMPRTLEVCILNGEFKVCD